MEKDEYKVLAKRGDVYLAVKNKDKDLTNIYEKGTLLDEEGNVILDNVLVGSALKYGYWEPIEVDEEKLEEDENIVRNCLIGAAVGDAFGVPYEFLFRDSIPNVIPDQMLGNDVNMDFYSDWGSSIPSGAWSDDTSMIVAAMNSMINNQGIDYDDIMKQFVSWWDEGKYASLDRSFGLGGTVEKALNRSRNGVPALECGGEDFYDNGNGSLMRILPFSLFCILNKVEDNEMVEIVSNGSALTHGNDISKMACVMYTVFLRGLIKTKDKDRAYERMTEFNYEDYFSEEVRSKFSKILNKDLHYDEIKESGYVVDTLEGALYSIMGNDNYENTIKDCVRLGFDTDTTACVAGSLAGALYGHSDIPRKWLSSLKKEDYLDKLSKRFMTLDNVYERKESVKK